MPETIPSVEKRLIAAIVALFILIAAWYSVAVPIFEVSDELRHYPMVKTLADGNGLPIQDMANPGPWRQEGSQPPLYYALGAAATFWIDTSDFGQVWRLNPHVDNGVITPDGNVNMVAHNYVREQWPWRGTVLAVHIVRLLSVLFSAGAVYFTYRIGRLVLRAKPWISLGGAAVAAFTPMFVYISGSVNNDNLATLLAAVAVWLMLTMLQRGEEQRPTLAWSIGLGITLGLGALTKQSVLGLFGLAGLTMAYAAIRQNRWQTFFVEGPLIVGIAALIAGWWYLRNWRLYGEVFGLDRMIAIAGARPGGVASLAQLWGERTGFIYSYWGLFGGVNIPMPGWSYAVFNLLSLLSTIGIVVWIARQLHRERFNRPEWMPKILTLLWIPFVFIPLIRWTSLTQASQGRLMFSAISGLSLWFVTGIAGWMPDAWGKWATGGLVAFLGALTLAAPVAWIGPAYRLPAQIDAPAELSLAELHPANQEESVLRLVAATYTPDSVQPGESVAVTLEWEALAPMDRNWSVFLHLQDSARLLAGQRDTYPGVGLLATSDLEPGRHWGETYVVPVRESAYAPETLDLRVGLYDYASGERMILTDGSDSALIGTLSLAPRDGDVPNPVDYDFSGQMRLRGYTVSQRTAVPGETIPVVLYWQGLASMDTNYSVSVQFVSDDGRVAGSKDSWPGGGDLPTATWQPGQQIEDAYEVPIAPDATPGVYNIQVIVYSVDSSGEIVRLKRLMPDGRLVDDRILLTQLWIAP